MQQQQGSHKRGDESVGIPTPGRHRERRTEPRPRQAGHGGVEGRTDEERVTLITLTLNNSLQSESSFQRLPRWLPLGLHPEPGLHAGGGLQDSGGLDSGEGDN